MSVAVLCMMKKRQRQRKVVVSRVGGTDGIVNAVYGGIVLFIATRYVSQNRTQ